MLIDRETIRIAAKAFISTVALVIIVVVLFGLENIYNFA
jgi:hypothetical protein